MNYLGFLVLLLEGTAAVSALYYFRKNPTDKAVGFFSYFLLLTYFVEAMSLFPTIIYWNEPLHFLKGTMWYSNFWLYNPYAIILFSTYILFFKGNITNKKVGNIIKKILMVYVLLCIVNLIFSGVFFQTHSAFTQILGSFFLVAVIFYYYIEILLTSKILVIKKEISFYISIIALLYFLTTTPIFIYYKYYTNQSPEFIQLSRLVLSGMNIFMYSSYILCFFWLAKRKMISIKEK
ncbi:hypothetical protein [Salinimicrobium sp. GXAS 041]|uniref:hypothetical protein n=1 Tax=Salinimicrobium sp. GXAS 041 TaxID=3400806 RepID=UPI003C739028